MIRTIDDLKNAADDDVAHVMAAMNPLADLDEYLESLNSKKLRFKHEVHECRVCGGTGTVDIPPRATDCMHPSSVDKCSKFIAYEMLGYEGTEDTKISPRTRRIFDTGSWVHRQLQDYCHAMYGDAFEEEVDGEEEATWAYGSCDGILDWPDYLAICGFEYKTIKEQNFHKLGHAPTRMHKRQGTVYQKIHDLPFMVYWYYNKNDSSMKQFVVPFDFKVWGWVEEKIEKILEAIQAGRFPEQDVHQWVCRDCDYSGRCPNDVELEP